MREKNWKQILARKISVHTHFLIRRKKVNGINYTRESITLSITRVIVRIFRSASFVVSAKTRLAPTMFISAAHFSRRFARFRLRVVAPTLAAERAYERYISDSNARRRFPAVLPLPSAEHS